MISRALAEHLVHMANQDKEPAPPGSVLEAVRQLRKDAAERTLVAVRLSEIERELLDGLPEGIELGSEPSLIKPVVMLQPPTTPEGVTAKLLDLGNDVHQSSPSDSGPAVVPAGASQGTVGDTGDGANHPSDAPSPTTEGHAA